MKILIVQEKENLARLIQDGLNGEGFKTEYVLNGEDAIKKTEKIQSSYGVVLIDSFLPKVSGLEVCAYFRKRGVTIPILLLTDTDDPQEIVRSLKAGIDDYLVKPFSFDILTENINALINRDTIHARRLLKAQNLILHSDKRIAIKDNSELKLTAKEFKIMEYLMRHPNQIVSRAKISSKVWNFNEELFCNNINVHVANLRKKIDDHENRVIETIHGLGYRINT